MTLNIQVTLSDSAYQRAVHLAKQQQQDVAEVIAAHLEQTLPDLFIEAPPDLDADVAREREAYLRLHPQLWPQYPHQYVAIYQEALVDHDSDKVALYDRIDEAYPEQFVLVRQVQAQPDPEYRMVSTRLDRQQK